MKHFWIWMNVLSLIGLGFSVTGYTLAQHGGDPPAARMSEREQCRSECHRKHCDEWSDCNNRLEDGTQRDLCKKQVEENETNCQKSCEAPKS